MPADELPAYRRIGSEQVRHLKVRRKASAKHVGRCAGEVALRRNRRQSAFLPRPGEMMRAEGRLTFAALAERVAWPR